MNGPGDPLLSVDALHMYYQVGRSHVRAVDGVSFTLGRGQTLGIAGESGCGKSSIALAVLGLLPANGRIQSGKIVLGGKDLRAISPEQMRRVRWKEIAMVFQGAMNALNPVMSVKDQLVEAVLTHQAVGRQEAVARAGRFLDLVGMPAKRLASFPHELSGGMKQRVVIAMALICQPKVVIADEPTTALDVVAQDQVMQLLESLQKELGVALVLISHDVSLIAESCEQLAVMYAGQFVEFGPTKTVFRLPRHPYTQGLMRSFPSIRGPRRKLQGVPGDPVDLIDPPPGCRFAARCAHKTEQCEATRPEPRHLGEDHYVLCHCAGCPPV